MSALMGKEDANLTQPMQAISRSLGQGTPLALILCDETGGDASAVGQVPLGQVHALIDAIADEGEEAGPGPGQGQEQEELRDGTSASIPAGMFLALT